MKRKPPIIPWLKLVREPAAVEPYASGAVANAGDVAQLMHGTVAPELVEVFWVLMLNTKNKISARIEITRGVLHQSLVHPREVFRAAILHGAASIIVCHNHPSDDPTPSADDRLVTQQLVEAGKILDLPVLDHVILTGDASKWFSFAEAGLL